MAKKKVAKRPVAKSTRSALPTTHKKARYEGVLFEFYNDDTSLELRGTVVIREDAMVVEIPEQDNIAESLIVGKPRGHYFQGSNSSRDPDALAAVACWADLGEAFAGTWQDDNDDLLFVFRLPKK
jgi:hypothetical protein